jgi:Tol biopolymer transport system component
LTATTGGFPNSWTPDGSALAVSFDFTIGMLERNGKTEPRRLLEKSSSIESQAEFSPDGRWLAYTSSATLGDLRQYQIYVEPYPALDRREQVSSANGSSAAWRQDGRELYYVENASADGPLKIRVMAVPITTTPTFSAGTPRVLFEGPFRVDGPFRGYDVTPDGQRFLMVREVPQRPAV